jgi:hypothetical protein
MSKTISFACALALGAIGPFTLQPGTASAVPVAGDLDGDLSGAADCAPLDPSVHPDAPDRPDLAFTDTNCDGVDGDAAKAVFVSTVDGSDAGTGTRLNPFKTIQAGINAAAPGGRDVYIAGGTYAESLALADDVSLYGGYEREFLHRSPAEVTKIAGPGGPAALAAGDTGVVLQQLTLQGRPDVSGNSYGLRAIPDGAVASQVVLEEVTSTADAAGAAINGFSGGTGLTGFGLAGGAGGAGGCNTVGSPGFLGSGSGVGSPGANGANGTVIAQSGPSWLRQSASNGGTGAPGAGGRGGTGGTGDNNSESPSAVDAAALAGSAEAAVVAAAVALAAPGRSASSRSTPPWWRCAPLLPRDPAAPVATVVRVVRVGLADQASRGSPGTA